MTRARLGALGVLAALLLGLAVVPARAQQDPDVRRAVVIFVRGMTFEQALEVPAIAALARSGGAGLVARPELIDEVAIPADRVRRVFLDPGVSGLGARIRAVVESAGRKGLLVLVISDQPPSAAGDELAPIVLAFGSRDELFASTAEQGSLTSDSTRRSGVVAAPDVAATLADALGVEDATPGAVIRPIEGPPPLDLHERYLAQRQLYIPIGVAAALYLAVVGLGAVLLLSSRIAVSGQVRRVFGWACLSVAMLATGLLAVGHLPELSYATVVPFVALVTVFGTLAFAPLASRSITMVPAGIGIAVLVFFALEALVGWDAALTPLVGGSHLDGGRFYGLPNAFIGLLIGASMWVAHRLGSTRGMALIGVVGLAAGFPLLGANLGGGVSLLAAAGLWFAFRERERLGTAMAAVVAAGITVAGTIVLLLAHAVSPVATHVTRFEEDPGGAGGIAGVFIDRLQTGFDLIARNPLALIPVLGLPLVVGLLLRPPSVLRSSLVSDPAWRDALLVTVLAGGVAYFANDSGPAAAGFAFGLGLGGLLGVPLLTEPAKMETP